MYGIVNKSIEELISKKFGIIIWNKIKKKSGVQVDFFLNNEGYDDAITYQLAGAAAEELNISVDAVLNAFGEWWIMHTCKEKYGAMMEAGGDDLKTFLLNLPRFHDRVMLMYPKSSQPEFKVELVDERVLLVQYKSVRLGLKEFVRGLMRGLSIFFNTDVDIELMESREQGDMHEVFKISWK